MRLAIDIASTISAQSTFGADQPFDSLVPLSEMTEEIARPVYKEFIPPMKLRRMGPILKMSMTTALDCIKRSELEIDAMILGTGLGCMKDTLSFMQQIKNSNGGILSPTAFIHSTHNTVSGQISLNLKNHGYNITHSQDNLSFEVSILDCMNFLNANSDAQHALLGGVDEKVPFLNEVKSLFKYNKYEFSDLSSSFIVSQAEEQYSGVTIDKVFFDYSSNPIDKVLSDAGLNISDFDIILHSDIESLEDLENGNSLNYLKYCGLNLSSSAFACHLAYEKLKRREGKKAIVINSICTESTGITLLSINE